MFRERYVNILIWLHIFFFVSVCLGWTNLYENNKRLSANGYNVSFSPPCVDLVCNQWLIYVFAVIMLWVLLVEVFRDRCAVCSSTAKTMLFLRVLVCDSSCDFACKLSWENLREPSVWTGGNFQVWSAIFWPIFLCVPLLLLLATNGVLHMPLPATSCHWSSPLGSGNQLPGLLSVFNSE